MSHLGTPTLHAAEYLVYLLRREIPTITPQGFTDPMLQMRKVIPEGLLNMTCLRSAGQVSSGAVATI